MNAHRYVHLRIEVRPSANPRSFVVDVGNAAHGEDRVSGLGGNQGCPGGLPLSLHIASCNEIGFAVRAVGRAQRPQTSRCRDHLDETYETTR